MSKIVMWVLFFFLVSIVILYVYIHKTPTLEKLQKIIKTGKLKKSEIFELIQKPPYSKDSDLVYVWRHNNDYKEINNWREAFDKGGEGYFIVFDLNDRLLSLPQKLLISSPWEQVENSDNSDKVLILDKIGAKPKLINLVEGMSKSEVFEKVGKPPYSKDDDFVYVWSYKKSNYSNWQDAFNNCDEGYFVIFDLSGKLLITPRSIPDSKISPWECIEQSDYSGKEQILSSMGVRSKNEPSR